MKGDIREDGRGRWRVVRADFRRKLERVHVSLGRPAGRKMQAEEEEEEEDEGGGGRAMKVREGIGGLEVELLGKGVGSSI